MIKIESYGIPGESQETRTDLELGAPYVLMSGDRPAPHYVAKVVDGVGVWVEPTDDIYSAREQVRTVMNPLRDTFLNRLAGIAVFTPDEAVKAECAELRTALLDITKDPAFLVAETYEAMESALMTRYRAIASGASTEVRNVFRELEA